MSPQIVPPGVDYAPTQRYYPPSRRMTVGPVGKYLAVPGSDEVTLTAVRLEERLAWPARDIHREPPLHDRARESSKTGRPGTDVRAVLNFRVCRCRDDDALSRPRRSRPPPSSRRIAPPPSDRERIRRRGGVAQQRQQQADTFAS